MKSVLTIIIRSGFTAVRRITEPTELLRETLDDWQRIYGGDGFYVIVDYTNPDIIYCESQFGNLGKSTNGGISFNSAMNGIDGNEPTNWSTPVIMDPNSPNILYYGTHSIYITTNGADNWT
jgi:hypothetical protein